MKKIAIMTLLALAACTHVEAGHVGVRVDSCEGGGIESGAVGVGYHTTGPCTSIIEYPTYQQTLTLDGSEALNVGSSEGMRVSADVSLSFTVDPAKVPVIYGKYKLDIDHIMMSYMRRTIQEDANKVFAKYTAQQLYSDKRDVARGEMQTLLTDKFKPDGFIVTQFTINQTRVPKSIEEAINGKVAMVQQAQQAEQAVRKTEAEAATAVAKAKGEAEATRVRTEAQAAATKVQADAEAYANHAIAKSVSRELIDYQRAQKWDGVLPKVTGGGNGLILGTDAIK